MAGLTLHKAAILYCSWHVYS